MKKSGFYNSLDKIQWLSKSSSIGSVLNTSYTWVWLPSSRDEQNPFSLYLTDKEKLITKEFVLESYKLALTSLRQITPNNHLLIYEQHNFIYAFKGSALFCVRHAAIEYALGKQGKWLEILDYYIDGYWPCGIKENGELVVM